MINKDREQRLERWQRKEESRYNRWYKVIKEERISEYLKKKLRGKQMKKSDKVKARK